MNNKTKFSPETNNMIIDAINTLMRNKYDLSNIPDLGYDGSNLDEYVDEAITRKRMGDLEGANSLYIKLLTKNLIPKFSAAFTWGWLKVLLLDKNFADASLVFKYFRAYYISKNTQYLENGGKRNDDIPDCFNNWNDNNYIALCSQAQRSTDSDIIVWEEKIASFGGSDYWIDNYQLSEQEFQDFREAFINGPNPVYLYKMNFI